MRRLISYPSVIGFRPCWAFPHRGSLDKIGPTRITLMKVSRLPRIVLTRIAVLFFAGIFGFGAFGAAYVRGQAKGSPEWTTSSFNPQRDAWQREETKLTAQDAGKIQLLWKLKTDNKTMEMHSFREPLIVTGLKTSGG